MNHIMVLLPKKEKYDLKYRQIGLTNGERLLSEGFG